MGGGGSKDGSKVSVGEGFTEAHLYFYWPTDPKPQTVDYKKELDPKELKEEAKLLKKAKEGDKEEALNDATNDAMDLIKSVDWKSLPYQDRVAVSLPPAKYESRYQLNGTAMLMPNKPAPTLLRDLLQNPKVRAMLPGFPFEKYPEPQISQLPDGAAKSALTTIQDKLPCNKWKVGPSITSRLGKVQDGRLIQTNPEKMKQLAIDKSKDPAVKKAGVALAKASVKSALGVLGIGSGGNPAAAQTSATNMGQALANDQHQADSLDYDDGGNPDEFVESQDPNVARFPRVANTTRVPVLFTWNGPAEKASAVIFRYHEGSAEQADKQVVAMTKGETGWQGTVQVPPGRWVASFEIDGKIYSKCAGGVPKNEGCGKLIEVRAITFSGA